MEYPESQGYVHIRRFGVLSAVSSTCTTTVTYFPGNYPPKYYMLKRTLDGSIFDMCYIDWA